MSTWMDLPLAELLPQRPPMVLLDGLLTADAHSCRAWVTVDPHAWYATPDGAMPAWFVLELMAQTAAAFGGALQRAHGTPPRVGYLLGTQTLTCTMPTFPPGTRLEITAQPTYRDDAGLCAFACEVFLEGQSIAQATLKAYEVPAT